jgi:hypothetical protein
VFKASHQIESQLLLVNMLILSAVYGCVIRSSMQSHIQGSEAEQKKTSRPFSVWGIGALFGSSVWVD